MILISKEKAKLRAKKEPTKEQRVEGKKATERPPVDPGDVSLDRSWLHMMIDELPDSSVHSFRVSPITACSSTSFRHRFDVVFRIILLVLKPQLHYESLKKFWEGSAQMLALEINEASKLQGKLFLFCNILR
jgi:hypothetical protein